MSPKKSLLVLLLFICTCAFSQTPPQRRKVKNFGSSLKKLQWDPVKKESVLVEPKTASDNEDAVDLNSKAQIYEASFNKAAMSAALRGEFPLRLTAMLIS